MPLSVWSKRPAVRAVALLTAGVALSAVWRLPPLIIFPILGIVTFGTGIARWWVRSVEWAACGLQISLFLSGCLIASIRRDQIETDVLSPKSFGERIMIDGRIESEPVQKGARSEMVVRSEFIRRDTLEFRIDRRLLIQIVRKAHWQDPDSLLIGDRVRVLGSLEGMPGARNPGEFDYGRYLALNGVQGFITVNDTNAVRLLTRSESMTWSDLAGNAQKIIYGVFDHYHRREEASFLKGVVFGYRGDLSAEVKQAFMNTGTTHILAVSGSNVVVVALIFYSLIGFFRVSSRVATAFTILGLMWYMVMTGMGPSVVRATIMACAVLVGNVIGRKGDIYNSLSFAALCMIAWDPFCLLDVGFQLSFAAVLSIVYFYPKLGEVIDRLPGKFFRISLVDSTLKLFAVSVAAQIGTLPFTAYYFGRVSLVSVLANLIVVPVSGLNTLLGFATLGCTYISGWAASAYAALNDLLVSLLLKFVLWSARVPFAYVETLGVGAMPVILYYVLVALLFNSRNPKIAVRSIGILLVFANVFVYAGIVYHPTQSFTVTMIDVGQGDAVLLEFPNGRHILMDTGPKFGQGDAGERTIVPYLKKRGISTLDAVVLSHAHDDHIGGCLSIFDRVDVRSIVVGDTSAVTKAYESLLREARRRSIAIAQVHAGECLQFDPSTRIFVLHPGMRLADGDPNDRSLVLKATYGAASLLLPGDASRIVEQDLLRISPGILACEVLKVAHHGASTSSSEEFIRSVKPELALISVGRLNKFNHPSRLVLTRYAALGVPVVRTDLSGAVILRSDGDKFQIVPWRKSGIL